MRRLANRDSITATRFDLSPDATQFTDAATPVPVFVECTLGFHLAKPADLSRIKQVAREALMGTEDPDQQYATLYDTLLNLDPDADVPLDDETADEEAKAQLLSSGLPPTPTGNIFVACLGLSERWEYDPGVRPEWIGAIAMFAPPGTETGGFVGAAEELPFMILEEGSLSATLLMLKAAYRSAKWMIAAYGTVRPNFTRVEDASTWFVDTLRTRALNPPRNPHAPNPPIQLPRLDDPNFLSSFPVEDHDVYFVYLHGLFSTDAGTFDGFIDAWDRVRNGKFRPAYGDNVDPIFNRCCHIGWPHDTLSGIEENADDLADLIEDVLGKFSGAIVLVCHSRGGLLARRTMQELVVRDPAWAKRIIVTLTFGTPHSGAELSTIPGRYEGAYLLLLDGTSQMVALDVLFVYQKHVGSIPGIDDLRPSSHPAARFLPRLEKKEGRNATGSIIAVGGDISQGLGANNMVRQAINWAVTQSIDAFLGTSQHDIVVSLASSQGAPASETRSVQCTHFAYFNHGVRADLYAIAELVADKLRIEERVVAHRDRNQTEFAIEIDDDGDAYLVVGDQQLRIGV